MPCDGKHKPAIFCFDVAIPVTLRIELAEAINFIGRECMDPPFMSYWCLVGNGMIITSDYGSFPKIPC